MARIAGRVMGSGPPPALQKQLLAMQPPAQTTMPGQLWSEALATARLGVTGNKPGYYSDEQLLLVLDGAIFNAEILPAGPDLTSRLALLIKAEGFVSSLKRLNGDFALAVYIADTQTLWLGRDRLGCRPLYYSQQSDGLTFASRPAGLGLDRLAPDRRYLAVYAASHYRYFDNEPEQSPYAKVSQLPAAHWLSWSPEGLKTDAYWSLQDAPELTGSESELAAQYQALLKDAVMCRFKTASSPAFTLSGGMDSSSVLACAVDGSQQRQQAYSSVYEDKTYDESEDIATILSATVEQWHPVLIEPGDVWARVREMVRLNDEPVATATWLSHYLICQKVGADGVGALFGGLGGDELNAGEYEYFFFHFADLLAHEQVSQFEQEADAWAYHHDHPIYRKNQQVARATMARVIDTRQPGRCLPDRVRLERYADLLEPEFFDLKTYVPQMQQPFRSYLKTRTWQDLFYETMPCCLRAQDRHGEAYGIEHHNPFLDYRLLEFMFRIPGALKIRQGVTKVLLREAMSGVLPDETRLRIKKTGWNAPAHVWFSGQATEELLDLVSSQRFRQRGIYRPEKVASVIREHSEIVSSGRTAENHMMFLWQLVNLECWLQQLEAAGPV